MRNLLVGILAITATSCATAPGKTTNDDPYENFNRSMLAFNLALDEAVLEPVSKGYTAVTPEYGRDRVSDFFQNLREPVTLVNDILQGEGERASQSGFRFVLNSTLGLAGLFDVASYNGLDAHKEDFGQTLATWGVDSGPYLVLPILGSTNPRDLFGLGVDSALLTPTNYARYTGDDDENTAIRAGLSVLNGINARAGAQDSIDYLRSQPEPYTALRRFHTESRDSEIRNGQTNPNKSEKLPEFGDF